MAAIRSQNTKPELQLRTALRAIGATGYRIHVRNLPGKPDIAFTRWRVAIFVDGAFWHGHPDHFNHQTASPYWQQKILRTQQRDQDAVAGLRTLGWSAVRCWDFELKANPGDVVAKVVEALVATGWQNPNL